MLASKGRWLEPGYMTSATSMQQMLHELIKARLAERDASIYRLIDYRISKGEWKLEDRQQHYAALLALLERETSGPKVSEVIDILQYRSQVDVRADP
jgi:hypothetical protein